MPSFSVLSEFEGFLFSEILKLRSGLSIAKPFREMFAEQH